MTGNGNIYSKSVTLIDIKNPTADSGVFDLIKGAIAPLISELAD